MQPYMDKIKNGMKMNSMHTVSQKLYTSVQCMMAVKWTETRMIKWLSRTVEFSFGSFWENMDKHLQLALMNWIYK